MCVYGAVFIYLGLITVVLVAPLDGESLSEKDEEKERVFAQEVDMQKMASM